jgi:hypothetical protein
MMLHYLNLNRVAAKFRPVMFEAFMVTNLLAGVNVVAALLGVIA